MSPHRGDGADVPGSPGLGMGGDGSAVAQRILIVDDEEYLARMLARALAAEGYDCATASSYAAATAQLESGLFALLISDINMPGRSGMDLLTWAGEHDPDLAVIMLTALDDRATADRALRYGAFGYIIKPFELNEIYINVANALERRRLSMESRRLHGRLQDEMRRRTAEIREREEEIALRLVAAAEYWDADTAAHVRRIGLFSACLADALGWGAEIVDDIRIAAMMHDVGKIAVPAAILRKAGRLTVDEFEVVKKHTVIGARILEGSTAPVIGLASEIALSHHERWDGSGYPRQLHGSATPEPARIVGIVDVYDALVHARPYKPVFAEPLVISEIVAAKGSHFEPRLVDVLLDSLPELRRIGAEVAAGSMHASA